jgi:hypothetical protein
MEGKRMEPVIPQPAPERRNQSAKSALLWVGYCLLAFSAAAGIGMTLWINWK